MLRINVLSMYDLLTHPGGARTIIENSVFVFARAGMVEGFIS